MEEAAAIKFLAVKRTNMRTSIADEQDGWDEAAAMHVLVPCHINDERRLAQFLQCAKSLAYQDSACRVFVGISGEEA